MDSLNFNSVETLPNLSARAAFQVNSSAVFKEDVDIVPVVIDDTLSYMPWGGDNNMPFDILKLIEDDETLSTCQMFNAEVCFGSGLRYDTCLASAAVKSEVDDFFLDNDIASYYLGVCQDFKHFGFAVSVIILSRDGTKIVRLLRKEACYCRFAPAGKDGRITRLLYANWRKCIASRSDIEVIEMLNAAAPWRDLQDRLAKNTTCRKFAVVSRIPTVDSTYYPIPYYASLFKGKWYNIKQLIGLAKESKLRNSAPIKYQIEISQKYWESIFRSEGITDRRKQIVLGVPLLPSVNHSVGVLPCVVREADVLVPFQQVVHHLCNRPPADVLFVQSAVVVQYQLSAVTYDHRVFDFTLLVEFPPGDHLVGLDVAVPLAVGHADVDMHETILALTAHH